MTDIRKATGEDFAAIWRIFHEIIVAGDTYANDETMTAEQAREMWLGAHVYPVVATIDGEVVGAYKLLPNAPGRGAHVANGSYIIDAAYRGRGVGRLLVEHSLQAARQLGYKAIQFNFVISTNVGAVKLYESLGFRILATLPKAFCHRELGYVDAYVMHRSLEEA